MWTCLHKNYCNMGLEPLASGTKYYHPMWSTVWDSNSSSPISADSPSPNKKKTIVIVCITRCLKGSSSLEVHFMIGYYNSKSIFSVASIKIIIYILSEINNKILRGKWNIVFQSCLASKSCFTILIVEFWSMTVEIKFLICHFCFSCLSRLK